MDFLLRKITLAQVDYMSTIKYRTLHDLDSVKYRSDRSVLIIHSLFPERFLSEEIAYPDKVKHLGLYLGFENHEYPRPSECLRQVKCNLHYGDVGCENCFTWDSKYNDTLCAGLTKFHNLETLAVSDLDLSTDLWIEFAKNCKCLKEIYFDSDLTGHKLYDGFLFETKREALDALFQIPTLETVVVEHGIQMPYFPPGPSNIKHLRLHVDVDDEEEQKEACEIYSRNLHTHTNIKTLVLTKGRDTPFNLSDLQIDKMSQLEELFLSFGDDVTEETLRSLPNLKKFHTNFDKSDRSSLIKRLRFILSVNSKIEEIGINTTEGFGPYRLTKQGKTEFCYNEVNKLLKLKEELKEELKRELKEELKDRNCKIIFVYFYRRDIFLDILD